MMTQQEVAELLGIDRSRVGQIERRALKKLRRALVDHAASMRTTVDECYDLATPEVRGERRAMAEFETALGAYKA